MRPERQRGWLNIFLSLLGGVKTWQTILCTEQQATFTDPSSANYAFETPASQCTSPGIHMSKIGCS